MKFSMTGQEKGDLLIQVTAWEGLNVHVVDSIQGYRKTMANLTRPSQDNGQP